MPSSLLTGTDEEAGAAGLTGGDCQIWSVLHFAVRETHLPQLGQGNPSPGPHLSHIQGTDVQYYNIMLSVMEPCFTLFYIKHACYIHFLCAGPCVWSVW